MTDDLGISREELHAFIDGELDPIRAAEIATLVANDPALCARMDAFRSDKNQLHQIYTPLSDLPLPQKWLQIIEDRTVRRRPIYGGPYFSMGLVALAACVLLMLGFWLTYERTGVAKDDMIVAEALSARQNRMAPSESFAATSVAPERRSAVLTGSLAMTLKAPDLSKLGYELTSLRIYSGVPGGRAVELGYRNSQNRLFTLYLRHPTGPPRVDLTESNGIRTCVWQDDVLGAVMLGEMSAGEMARIASLAYSGLTL
jgi:anti-sigma factor RsiW